jgi:hypothetical protein
MSLWTPDGEVPIDRSGTDQAPAGSASEMLGGPELEDLSPEERARAEEMIARMAEVQRQLLSVPAAQIIVNHLMGLYELAAVHLDQPEPQFEEARLAIDAMGALLEVTQHRLGEAGTEMREALTVLQTFYVRRTSDSGED